MQGRSASSVGWIARDEVRQDVVTAAPLDRLAALLDYTGEPWPSGAVPPLAHWFFLLPDARQSMLGPDGHPRRDDFMPPIAQPRRMWAGSRVTFPRTLHVGDVIERRSSVANVADKGHMTFVTIRHEISASGQIAVVEEQDLVYLPERAANEPVATKSVPVPDPENVRSMAADETLLLRFSALTFNAHRIHYDLAYATGVEHYPGLVVHGPLLATLLIDHALRADREAHVTAFEFRARAPVICGERFDICRSGAELWIRKTDGKVAMTARIATA